MAWDASRRGPEALPPNPPDRHLLCVDEVKINNSQTLQTQHAKANMGGLLSPIVEEDRILALDAPLQITVLVRFHDPTVRSVYSRTYCTSPAFVPTDRICRGLLRRINHCSEEFITRRDTDALNSAQCLRKGPKSLRFELVFEIHRKGDSSPWACRIFRSYQKRALTDASARDVIRSTHNTIGIFLRHHDSDFRWTDDPTHEHVPARPETFKPSPTGPLELTCIPRARFIESTQAWEFVPGYSLKLILRSNNPARYQHGMRRLLKIDSSQATPLNLDLGEDLVRQAFRSVQDTLDPQKNVFDPEHNSCNGFETLPGCDCQHSDEGALSVELRVVNNLGPIYEHLARSPKSSLRLLSHSVGQDCDDLVSKISARLTQCRDTYDSKLEKLNDFDFRITELTGHGWQEKNCARFVIDGTTHHSRQTVEALLDRIRTGVCAVLRGHDVAVHMVAYKRGHLVLDKALIARDHQYVSHQDTLGPVVDEKRILVAELQARVRRDIDAICKDTCTLDDVHAPAPATPERSPRYIHSFSTPRQPSTPCSPLSRSHEWPQPGSPGSFATRPATPPQGPLRKSSRVFPLVPAKYKEETEQSPSGALTLRDSAIGMDSLGDVRALDGTARPESVGSLRLPSIILEDHHELASGDDNKSALQPAAEVYPAPRTPDCETDSNSTHSSMPALSESDDAPSPQASMLITPNVVRSASPGSRGVPCYDDTDLTHFPGPLMLSSSAPNSTTFPEVERFAEPKVAQPQPKSLQARPTTPMRTSSAEKSAAGDTPKAPVDCSGDEKTPLAHRQMQGPTDSDPTRHCGVDVPATHETPPPTNDSNTDDILPSQGSSETKADFSANETEAPKSAEHDLETAQDDLEFAQDDLPTEGLSLCHVEEEFVLASESHDNPDITHASAAVATCESSENLMPLSPDTVLSSQGSDTSDAYFSAAETPVPESGHTDLPTEGFLLCHVEEEFVPVSGTHENSHPTCFSDTVEESVSGSEPREHITHAFASEEEKPGPVSEVQENPAASDASVAVEEELVSASKGYENTDMSDASVPVEEELMPVSEVYEGPAVSDALVTVEEELVPISETHEDPGVSDASVPVEELGLVSEVHENFGGSDDSVAVEEELGPVSEVHEIPGASDNPVAVEEELVPVSKLYENPAASDASVAVEEELVPVSEAHENPGPGVSDDSVTIEEKIVPVSEAHENREVTDTPVAGEEPAAVEEPVAAEEPVAVEEDTVAASEKHDHPDTTHTLVSVEETEPVSELRQHPDANDNSGTVEEESKLVSEHHENTDATYASVVTFECTSPETLNPSMSLGDGYEDNDAGPLNEDPGRTRDEAETHHEDAMKDEAELSHTAALPDDMACDVPEQVEEGILPEINETPEEAEFSGPTVEPGSGSWPESAGTFGHEPAPDDESCDKSEHSEQDNDSAIGSEALDCNLGDKSQSGSDTGSVGLSEGDQFLAHALPFSDSGIDIGPVSDVADVSGPEIDEVIPSSTDEASLPRAGLSLEDTELTESGQEKISEPIDKECERLGDETTLASPSILAMVAAQVPDVVHDDPEPAEEALVPAPKPALAALSPPKPRISVPNHRTSRSISNSHPSPSQIGLGKSYLLPPLPLFANFTANGINTSSTRDSWSSSSSWEDYVSIGRQSSDSVDTIKQSPLPLSDDGTEDCPKRLGTPTAGLLGLNESRWADFGLRTALTGTHAFDESSSTQQFEEFEDHESSRDETKLKREPGSDVNDDSEKHSNPSSSRKGFHLRHKSSVASIILAGRLSRKGSRELRQPKKKQSKELKKQAKAVKPTATATAKKPVSESVAPRDKDDSAGRLPQAMMLVAGLAFASSLVSRNH